MNLKKKSVVPVIIMIIFLILALAYVGYNIASDRAQETTSTREEP